MSQSRSVSLNRGPNEFCGGTSFEELSGGNWMTDRRPPLHGGGLSGSGGFDPSRSPPLLVITTSAFLSGRVRPGVSALLSRGSSSSGA
jgi:hypothetical protein